MATTFGIKRGYVNGNHIFIATFKGETYKIDELGKLSEEVLKVFDSNNDGGIFNPNTKVMIRFGTETKEFTFTALDLFNDTPANLKTNILDRFQQIMAWKATMNAFEEFNLIF